jgi:carboxymethylenebutenolidase
MKKLPHLFFIALAATLMACGGNNPKENQKEESFEDLGDQAEFKEKHDEPKTMEVAELNGEMIDFAVEGGQRATAYAAMKDGSDRYVLVFHEWWGLNDYVKREADRLSKKLGYVNVIALDLYDGKIATERDSAQKYMQMADKERIMSIINGALKKIPSNASIATIGWCFGGGWSLQAAIEAGDRAEACVMYYGMPEKDVDRLKKLNSDVLFIFAEKDQWINQEVADAFAENMKETDNELIVKSFDADHAFANPTQESYVEAAANEANAMAIEFLKAELLDTEEGM